MPYRVMVVDSEFQKVTIWPTKFPWRVNELQGITPVITDDQFGHIKELAKKVIEETDPDKYIELVQELNQILDEVIPPPTPPKS